MQKEENPYMSAADLASMTEKEKIVEEMAHAAKIEEALHKEQARQSMKARSSLMMLDEEDKREMRAKLKKQMMEDKRNQNDTAEE